MIVLNIIFDNKKYIISLILTLIICAGFAASDEFYQTFLNRKTGQVMDLLIDLAGAVVGLMFYSTYHIVYKNGY